ncbi:MAG: hypothetical protein RIQ72_82 [Candidatus Parcubacteria bacterium]|jgi:hypothetical protein
MQSAYNTNNKERGSTLIYAMMIIALFLIAYAAYFFATLKPTNPYDIKDKYEQLYVGNQNDVNQSDFNYEQDLYGQFGNRVEQPSASDKADGSVSRYVGEPILVQPQDDTAQTGTDSRIGAPQNQDESGRINQEVNQEKNNNDTPIIAGTTVLDSTYTSKNNSRITFPIPAGTKVKEVSVGTDDISNNSTKKSGQLFTFSIKEKDVTISTEKVAAGCFNPLISFAIPSGLGVDYRILYTQKEVTLSNTYRAIIGTEEYGTYKGMAGYRGTSCVQSAVPTKIDIRSAGWKKAEQQEVLKMIEELLSKMTV